MMNSSAVFDLRDLVEYRVARVPGAITIPQPNLDRRLEEIDHSRGLVLYCIAGKRTKRAEQTLLDQGVDKVFHLDGVLTVMEGWPATPEYERYCAGDGGQRSITLLET